MLQCFSIFCYIYETAQWLVVTSRDHAARGRSRVVKRCDLTPRRRRRTLFYERSLPVDAHELLTVRVARYRGCAALN